MRVRINDERTGNSPLVYNESFWTGKREVMYNGALCSKISKSEFAYNNEDGEFKTIYIKGNQFVGLKLIINNNEIVLVETTKWYIWLLAILTTILEMLFIFGGLIGGAISGVLFCLKLLLSKKGKNALLQILIVLGISVVYSVTVLIIAFVFGLSIGIIGVL